MGSLAGLFRGNSTLKRRPLPPMPRSTLKNASSTDLAAYAEVSSNPSR